MTRIGETEKNNSNINRKKSRNNSLSCRPIALILVKYSGRDQTEPQTTRVNCKNPLTKQPPSSPWYGQSGKTNTSHRIHHGTLHHDVLIQWNNDNTQRKSWNEETTVVFWMLSSWSLASERMERCRFCSHFQRVREGWYLKDFSLPSKDVCSQQICWEKLAIIRAPWLFLSETGSEPLDVMISWNLKCSSPTPEGRSDSPRAMVVSWKMIDFCWLI